MHKYCEISPRGTTFDDAGSMKVRRAVYVGLKTET